MRISRLPILFALTASAPSLAQTGQDIKPDETFSVVLTEGQHIYAKPSTMDALRFLLPDMARLAGKDIVFIEPAKLDASDRDGLLALPPVASMFSAPNLIKIEKSDAPAMRVFKETANNQMRSSHESLKSNFFLSVLVSAGMNQEGRNYSSNKLLTSTIPACFIYGDLDIGSSTLGKMLGSIPDALVTDKFLEWLPDAESLKAFILFHESRHCSQKTKISYLSPGEMVLEGEIDSDNAALSVYQSRAGGLSMLDKNLPEKIHALRLLAPLLMNNGKLDAVLASVMSDHATAPGLNSDSKVSSVAQQSSLMSVIVKAVILEMADPAKIAALRPDARREVDSAITPVNGGRLDAMMPGIHAFLEDMMLSSLLQKDDPTLVYDALDLLVRHGWDDERKANFHASDNLFLQALGAWDMASLARPASSRLAEFENRKGLMADQKLSASTLPMTKRLIDLMKMNTKAQLEAVSGPRP